MHNVSDPTAQHSRNFVESSLLVPYEYDALTCWTRVTVKAVIDLWGIELCQVCKFEHRCSIWRIVLVRMTYRLCVGFSFGFLGFYNSVLGGSSRPKYLIQSNSSLCASMFSLQCTDSGPYFAQNDTRDVVSADRAVRGGR